MNNCFVLPLQLHCLLSLSCPNVFLVMALLGTKSLTQTFFYSLLQSSFSPLLSITTTLSATSITFNNTHKQQSNKLSKNTLSHIMCNLVTVYYACGRVVGGCTAVAYTYSQSCPSKSTKAGCSGLTSSVEYLPYNCSECAATYRGYDH